MIQNQHVVSSRIESILSRVCVARFDVLIPSEAKKRSKQILIDRQTEPKKKTHLVPRPILDHFVVVVVYSVHRRSNRRRRDDLSYDFHYHSSSLGMSKKNQTPVIMVAPFYSKR